MNLKAIREKLFILSQTSLEEAILLVSRSLSGRTGKDERPYDEFVFADTLSYIISVGGYSIKEGNTNKISFVNSLNQEIVFSLRRKTTDFHIFNQTFRTNEYQQLIKLANDLKLPENLIIVDAGSNVGCTPIWFSCVFPKSRIFSLEIEQGNFEQLQRNIQINSKEEQITPLCLALWHKSEELVISDSFRDGREYAFSVELPNRQETTQSKAVQGISTKELRNKFGIEQIHILKIDIEGAEKFLLEELDTASETLESVHLLALEIHDDVVSRPLIEANLDRLGFRWFNDQETLFAFRQ